MLLKRLDTLAKPLVEGLVLKYRNHRKPRRFYEAPRGGAGIEIYLRTLAEENA